MARKRVQAAIPPKGTPLPETAVQEVPDSELEGLFDEADISRKLRDWVARENPEQVSYLTYLYKYDHPTTGDAKVLCTRYDNEIPDPHEIGLAFGSGRYLVMVNIPETAETTKKIRALRVRLGTHYDTLKKQAEAGLIPGFQPPGAMAPGAMAYPPAALARGGMGGVSEGLELVERVLGMFLPLIAAQQSTRPDMSAMMQEQYGMISGVLKRSLADQQELARDVIRARVEAGKDEDEDEDEGEGTMLERILPLIEKFVPLLTTPGPQASATAAMVRSVPQFAEVLKDRGELVRIIKYLDMTQGQAKTDAVLRSLKVARPGKASPSRARRNGRTHARVTPQAATG